MGIFKFVTVFIFISLFVSCTKKQGDAQGFSGRHGSYLMNPAQIQIEHMMNGSYRFAAPQGTVVTEGQSPSEVLVSVWNIDRSMLTKISSSSQTSELIDGINVGNFAPENDGSFSASFPFQPIYDVFIITVTMSSAPNVVAIPFSKEPNKTTAAYSTILEGTPSAVQSMFSPVNASITVISDPDESNSGGGSGAGASAGTQVSGGGVQTQGAPVPEYVTLTDLGNNTFRAVIRPGAGADSDTYVENPNPSTNQSASQGLLVGKEPNPGQYPGWARRSLLSFEYSFIPVNATIMSALLRVYKVWQMGSLTFNIGLFKVAPFDFSTVTWNNQPTFTTAYASTTSGTTNGERVFVGGVAMITDIQNSIGGVAKIDLGLKQTTPSNDVHYFGSANGGSSQPSFEIVYTIP